MSGSFASNSFIVSLILEEAKEKKEVTLIRMSPKQIIIQRLISYAGLGLAQKIYLAFSDNIITAIFTQCGPLQPGVKGLDIVYLDFRGELLKCFK